MAKLINVILLNVIRMNEGSPECHSHNLNSALCYYAESCYTKSPSVECYFAECHSSEMLLH